MICLKTVEKYCKEYWKIENYDLAMADESQVWDCHHIHEIDWTLPKEELISIGRYYDVHYSELIFLPHDEHMKLHSYRLKQWRFCKGNEPWNKGKKRPEISGPKHWYYKQKRSQEVKDKIHRTLCEYIINHEGYNEKYKITKEDLYKYYIIENLSQTEIAKIYGCHQGTISNKLKKYNIKK